MSHGGNGYSGGGAYGSAGGSNGGDGDDFLDSFKGGAGSGLIISSDEWTVLWSVYNITAGTGGTGNTSYGGGGGGGVLVDGEGPQHHEFQGQGYGGGGSGYNDQTVSGLNGCAILEIVPQPRRLEP